MAITNECKILLFLHNCIMFLSLFKIKLFTFFLCQRIILESFSSFIYELLQWRKVPNINRRVFGKYYRIPIGTECHGVITILRFFYTLQNCISLNITDNYTTFVLIIQLVYFYPMLLYISINRLKCFMNNHIRSRHGICLNIRQQVFCP